MIEKLPTELQNKIINTCLEGLFLKHSRKHATDQKIQLTLVSKNFYRIVKSHMANMDLSMNITWDEDPPEREVTDFIHNQLPLQTQYFRIYSSNHRSRAWFGGENRYIYNVYDASDDVDHEVLYLNNVCWLDVGCAWQFEVDDLLSKFHGATYINFAIRFHVKHERVTQSTIFDVFLDMDTVHDAKDMSKISGKLPGHTDWCFTKITKPVKVNVEDLKRLADGNLGLLNCTGNWQSLTDQWKSDIYWHFCELIVTADHDMSSVETDYGEFLADNHQHTKHNTDDTTKTR